MENFVELTVYTTHLGSELISDILWNYTDSGVVISDIEDVIELSKTGKTWDYMEDDVMTDNKEVIIKAYFPIDSAEITIKKIENDLINLNKNCEFDLGTLETAKRKVNGDAWKEQWKEHFKPIHIGKVVVVPEWIKYKEKQGEIKILLDSNMAFGTGEHETTSMCLEFLSKYVKISDKVLDVGCGSGILGITASKLGAKTVLMTDIDECAVSATEHNMALNNVLNAKVILKNLLDDNTIKGDVIVANIMAELLVSFAPKIGDNLEKDGIIILSGILTDRIDKVVTAYTQNNFKFIEQKIKGEWSALVFEKVD